MVQFHYHPPFCPSGRRKIESIKKIITRPFKVLLEAIIAFNDDNSLILSSSVSFYFILSIIPFTLFAFSFLAYLLSDPTYTEKVYDALSYLVAKQEVIGWLKDTITAIISGRGTTTITGAVSLLLVSVGMFRSLEYVLNHIFGVRPRSYIRSYLIGIGFSLILNILLLITVVASPVFNMLNTSASHALADIYKNYPWLNTLVDLFTSWFLFALISFFIYFVLPNIKQRFRDVLWGAITAGLLWGLLKILFNIYLNYFSNMTLVYGALAVVLGAIIWVYMSTIIIIFGAEITHVLGLRSKGVPAPSFDNLFRRASRSLLSINLPVKLQKGKTTREQKPS